MSNTPTEKIDRVARGVWGGEHIQMEVTENGARLEYDCAHGTIEQPLVLDDAGRFEWTGTHTRERGGPVRIGDKPDSHPARYTGHVDGKTMTLTLTLTDTQDTFDPYTLTQGDYGIVRKCLYSGCQWSVVSCQLFSCRDLKLAGARCATQTTDNGQLTI